MRNSQYYYLIFLIPFFFACDTKSVLVAPPLTIDNELLDTLVVSAKRLDHKLPEIASAYNPSRNRRWDLLHSSLNIAFNMDKRSVLGEALLTLTPYFYPSDSLILDARNFEIHELGIHNNAGEIELLKFNYDQEKLKVKLTKEFCPRDTLVLSINYTAFPEKNAKTQQYAIGSDQGLFFIDPLEIDPLRPTQIWTQGETEYNSRWFPTIDSPNERCTQELFVRVKEDFQTLSNGLLLDQTFHEDGTRTDYWKLDLPHAPYLFSLVVGRYYIEKDTWHDIDLEYYVYPEYRESAKAIYKHTPEMLSFFSDLTGVDYPWPKYSQVIVSDFVSGAMENTTAVTFSEGFLKTKEEILDYPNDDIVAHEMFHHWFGNLVTCESWANLTLNEGFANYAEYLWKDHKYGKDVAEFHRYNELLHYLNSAAYQTHPLIHFSYEDKDGMFDTHSYNKGSLVLHMLRKMTGDHAFFASINRYLKDHSYNSAEIHDLRLAFEAVTGQDLNWFFDQWFLDKGHPVLEVEYRFIDSLGLVEVDLAQVQDKNIHREVFKFPLSIQMVFPDGSKKTDLVWIDKRKQSFTLKTNEKPAVVLINDDYEILCDLYVNYHASEYQSMFLFSNHVVNRYMALGDLRRNSNDKEIMYRAIEDPSPLIRRYALHYLPIPFPDPVENILRNLAIKDESSAVRNNAILLLFEQKLLSTEQVLEILDNDGAASVIATCLELLHFSGHPDIEKLASRWYYNRSFVIENVLAGIFSTSADPKHLDFYTFRKHQNSSSDFINGYSDYLLQQDPGVIFDQCMALGKMIKSLKSASALRRNYLVLIENQLGDLKRKADKPQSASEKEKLLNNIRTIEKMLQ